MKSFDLGGVGLPLHFLHANGYPPDCYKTLLELFKAQYHVFGMLLRPLWGGMKPEDIHDWKPFSDDLRLFLSSQRDSVIGVGHSIGAVVTLRAALRDPAKFRALILLDPVLFMPRRIFAWNLLRISGLADRVHPLIIGAKKRRRTFDDLDTVYRSYRNRNIFRFMSDENLRIHIESMTKPGMTGGYELAFSPEWEAQIYRTAARDFDIWRDLPKLDVPTLFIRGAETDTFLEETAKLVKQKQPKVRVEALEKSTHLLPLERPKEVFDMMQSFLKEVL